MLLYHGTLDWRGNSIMKNGIDLNKSKQYLDFGRGFYTTPLYQFAKNTAEFKAERHNMYPLNKTARPCILTFEFEEYLTQFLNVQKFERVTKEWCEFVVANRIKDDTMRIGKHHNFDAKYDIVYGDTADGIDGSIENIVSDIEQGILCFDEIDVSLIDPTNKPNWGSQISFHTPESLYCIRCTDCAIL